MNRLLLPPRPGRVQHEYALMLALIVVTCVGVVVWLTRDHPEDNWFWDGVSALFLAALSFLAFVLVLAVLTFLVFLVLFLIDYSRAAPGGRGAIVHDFRVFSVLFVACVFLLLLLVLAMPLLVLCLPVWLVALGLEGVEALRRVRTARRLDRLRRLNHERRGGSVAADLRFATGLLRDRDEEVRREAFKATASLLRGHPVPPQAAWRATLEKALPEHVSFARAVGEAGRTTPLPALVTLGGKLGAGTAEKRVSPATSDPAELAAWLKLEEQLCRLPGGVGEVQVSVGYDTGPLPFQEERGRFLALYLFVTSTDLKRFQSLTRRPARDPNAAYGLLIRGDRVDVMYPGQCSGRRLDYVFPYPSEMSEASLAEFLRQFQVLNLGMLLASAEESYRACFPGEVPPWMDARMRAVAREYRRFERQLVGWLRRHDGFRDPDMIYALDRADHRERKEAFRQHRLEECLYPQHSWVVPLYGEDASWDRLLPLLRTVEGMMLHQGPGDGETLTRGASFIRGLRLLGYRAAAGIDEALGDESASRGPAALLTDPFIDADHEAATRHYLAAMSHGLRSGEVAWESLPDAATFRSASAYYRVEPATLDAKEVSR